MRIARIFVAVVALGFALAVSAGVVDPAASSVADFPRCCYPGDK